MGTATPRKRGAFANRTHLLCVKESKAWEARSVQGRRGNGALDSEGLSLCETHEPTSLRPHPHDVHLIDVSEMGPQLWLLTLVEPPKLTSLGREWTR